MTQSQKKHNKTKENWKGLEKDRKGEKKRRKNTETCEKTKNIEKIATKMAFVYLKCLNHPNFQILLSPRYLILFIQIQFPSPACHSAGFCLFQSDSMLCAKHRKSECCIRSMNINPNDIIIFQRNKHPSFYKLDSPYNLLANILDSEAKLGQRMGKTCFLFQSELWKLFADARKS